MDESTRASNATLATAAENAVDHTSDRVIQISIAADNRGRFPSELQRDGHELFCGELSDAQAHVCATGKRDAFDERMAHKRIAHDRAFTRHDAQNSGRQTSLLANPRQLNGHARRDLGGLDDYRAARSQSRRDLLRFTGDGRIPRRDRGHYTQRLM